MSPEGTPIQVNANVLQAAAAQNVVGRFTAMTILMPFLKNCQFDIGK